MKNFNVKQSGSEVILEEVNPHKDDIYSSKMLAYKLFTPLILTSIDPQIKVGDLIREDQLEIIWQFFSEINTHWVNCYGISDVKLVESLHFKTRQVAKLKQVVEEKPKSERVIINRHASDNHTWLAPYSGQMATLATFPNGDIEILIDGETEPLYALGGFVSGNDWHYIIHDIVDRVETPIQEEETEKVNTWIDIITEIDHSELDTKDLAVILTSKYFIKRN